MFLNFLLNNFWFSVIIVNFIHISDYLFTLKLSYLYHKGAKKYIEFEGGIELNPLYRKDINKLKKFNPKFIIALIGLNILFFFSWYTSIKMAGLTGPFEFVLGASILTEFFIHTRHFQNYFRYQAALKPNNMKGHIKFFRSFIHKSAAIDALVFAAFYFILWLLIGRIFFLGGAFTCLILAQRQKSWLKNYIRSGKVL